MESIIQVLIYVFSGYLLIGLAFSVLFYMKGLSKIDKNAIGSTLGFKLIIFPGVLMLWPFLLTKWLKIK